MICVSCGSKADLRFAKTDDKTYEVIGVNIKTEEEFDDNSNPVIWE
jgi:hypothetical protein